MSVFSVAAVVAAFHFELAIASDNGGLGKIPATNNPTIFEIDPEATPVSAVPTQKTDIKISDFNADANPATGTVTDTKS